MLLDGLRACIRTSIRGSGRGKSIVARVGGDEFAILLTHIQSEADPATVSMRILERLGQPFYLEGDGCLSRPVSELPQFHWQYPRRPSPHADTAIVSSQSKRQRAPPSTSTRRCASGSISRIETESGLRKAIDNNQLCPSLPANRLAQQQLHLWVRGACSVESP